VLVLAGDIDSRLARLERFAGWPVPVLFVAGNHEFDGREVDAVAGAARALRGAGHRCCTANRPCWWMRRRPARALRRHHVRWSDFDLFGAAGASARCAPPATSCA
jgi:hypothetical protein